MRTRLYRLCMGGEGGFDWTGLEALKSHVTLREALEIEAVKCVAGDERHAFQEWYSTEWPKLKNRQAQASLAQPELDPEVAAEEAEGMRQMLAELEQDLQTHRTAVATGQPSPFSDADVDHMHMVIAALQSNLAGVDAIARGEA